MKKIGLFILLVLFSFTGYGQTAVANAELKGYLQVGSGNDRFDSIKIENDTLYLKTDGSWITAYQSLPVSDICAENNHIFDGDAGDFRGTNTEPDFCNVSLGQVNCSDGVSTNYAHGGTRSIAITSSSSGATYYGGIAINNSSLRKVIYPLSYRMDFWVYVPTGQDWSGNLTVTSTGTINGKQTWANQSISLDTWTHIECDVTIEGDESIVFNIEYTADGTGDIYYLDDMRWRTIYSSLGSEEFTYADCESGTATVGSDSWSTYSGTWERSSDMSHNGGSYSMKATQTYGAPELMDFSLRTVENTSLTDGYYLIGAWFYTADTDIIFSDCGHYYQDENSDYWIMALDHYYGYYSTWYYREEVIYVEEGTPDTDRYYGLRLNDQGASGGAIVYVDDFTMKKISF